MILAASLMQHRMAGRNKNKRNKRRE